MLDKFNFLKALELKCASRVEEAKTTLNLYLSNPQAVADHSDLMNELDKWLGILADSEDKLRALKALFPERSDPGSDYVITYTNNVVESD